MSLCVLLIDCFTVQLDGVYRSCHDNMPKGRMNLIFLCATHNTHYGLYSEWSL